MIETIGLKKELLTGLLNKPRPMLFAHILSAVDAIYTIYQQQPKALIYTDFTPYKSALRLFSKPLTASNMKQVIGLAKRKPTGFYVFLIPEIDLEKNITVSYLLELLNDPVDNFGLVVVGVNGKDSGDYYPIFKSKRSPHIARPYQVYYTIPGEGFGELENTKEVLAKALTRELYETWLSNIDEIEERKSKLLAEAKQNANEESKTTQ